MLNSNCPLPTRPPCAPRSEYGYCRDRAVATLSLLLRDGEGGCRAHFLRYGLRHLVAMVRGGGRQGGDRWEARDAATLLLKLGLGEVSEGLGVGRGWRGGRASYGVGWGGGVLASRAERRMRAGGEMVVDQ